MKISKRIIEKKYKYSVPFWKGSGLSLDDDDFDKLSPRARPRGSSLTRQFSGGSSSVAENRLSLPPQNLRASSMEQVDKIGKGSPTSPLSAQLLFPDTTEARSSFHGIPSRARRNHESGLSGKKQVTSPTESEVTSPTAKMAASSKAKEVTSRVDKNVESPTYIPPRRPQLLFPDDTDARSSFHGLPSKARKQSSSDSNQLELPSPPEKKSWSFRRLKFKSGTSSASPPSSPSGWFSKSGEMPTVLVYTRTLYLWINCSNVPDSMTHHPVKVMFEQHLTVFWSHRNFRLANS